METISFYVSLLLTVFSLAAWLTTWTQTKPSYLNESIDLWVIGKRWYFTVISMICWAFYFGTSIRK